MRGITQELSNQFEERIRFLKNKIDCLHQDLNNIKSHQNVFKRTENLMMKNPYWKAQIIDYKNELSFLNDILKDVIIID